MSNPKEKAKEPMLDGTIPVIDLEKTSHAALIECLRETCETTGFFYLQGHGISDKRLQEVLQQSKNLFDLPVHHKRGISDPVMTRGYTGMGEETLDPEVQTAGDTKEGFYIGRDIAPDHPSYNPAKLSGPNVWPSPVIMPDGGATRFREVMELYFREISEVGFRVVQMLAECLGLPPNHFDSAFQEPLAALRLLHYDAVTSKPEEGVFACGAHSDYGMITLLLTDENPGLQILTQNNHWIDVPPCPGALVVNLGDMLERWTNGMFRSTKHRVLINDRGQERYSIPFFYEPAFDTIVECLPQCCSVENLPRFKPTTSGQHLLDKYKQTHADFKPDDS